MEFEWDENKAHVNIAKHGISFDEAKTSFSDPLYIDFYDPDHAHEGKDISSLVNLNVCAY